MTGPTRLFLTGGTGSFGNAFTALVLRELPDAAITIYSRDELKQFEMAESFKSDRLSFVIGDVRDEKRLTSAMKNHDVVVHAAAMKQVPTSEHNPLECIKTNIGGAENVIDAAQVNHISRVVALSTDKACNPINLYGATKLCSDKLFIAANQLTGASGTKFSIVRYGNVIGSRGSVIPFFKARAKSGSLPITHQDMTRFWISLDQGAALVLSTLRLMRGGEIIVPKIPSMRITDLATAIAPDCRQEVIGIRPGERMHEVMVPRDEAINTLEFEAFYIIQPSFNQSGPAEYGGETGRPVPQNFEYRSDSNSDWLTLEDLRKVI